MEHGPPLEKPLLGKRLVSTRPRAMQGDVDDRFEQVLAAWGAEVYSIPLIEIRPMAFDVPEAATYDWLFFTSKNAVQAFFQKAPPCDAKIASVGPATGKALIRAGQAASFIPPIYEGEAAAQAFIATYGDTRGRLEGVRILWPCGNLANQSVKEVLQEAGASVDALPVYETTLVSRLTPEAEAVFRSNPDLLIFTSPSGVQAYDQLGLPREGVKIAVLGPITERAACGTFGGVTVKAPVYTLDALANAVYEHYRKGAADHG